MASPHHTLPSPDIANVMKLMNMMKIQNEEILAKNEEILIKLNSIEDDNQKLRQELLEMKSCLKHKHNGDSLSSRKRDEQEDKVEHENENTNSIKRAKVTGVTSVPDPPASFDTLDDDCLGNVLEFVGKKCYSAFGLVNKRCHEMFCSKGLPKESYLFGYAPLRLIQERRKYNSENIPKGVLHYNHRDIFEWILADESDYGYSNLRILSWYAITETRLDILREVFQRVNEQQVADLRAYNGCYAAAQYGKLECLEFLRENKCGWHEDTWNVAKREGHEHILEYLQNNGYPTEWQVDSESDSEDSDY